MSETTLEPQQLKAVIGYLNAHPEQRPGVDDVHTDDRDRAPAPTPHIIEEHPGGEK